MLSARSCNMINPLSFEYTGFDTGDKIQLFAVSAEHLSLWRDVFAHCIKTPLTQSPDYAKVVEKTKGFQPQYWLMMQGDKPIGTLLGFHRRSWGGAYHILHIDRGPCFIASDVPDDVYADVYTQINTLYPRRMMRYRRLIPEWIETPLHKKMLLKAGFKLQRESQPYETIWMDLSDMDGVIGRMHKSLRYDLRRADRVPNVDIMFSHEPAQARLLLSRAQSHRAQRGYRGASPIWMRMLLDQFVKGDGMTYASIRMDKVDVAGALFLHHGTSATWQTGWVSDTGRDHCLNIRLLIQSMIYLKDKGIRWLDLGGIQENAAPGVTLFKKRMGGQHVRTFGIFN